MERNDLKQSKGPVPTHPDVMITSGMHVDNSELENPSLLNPKEKSKTPSPLITRRKFLIGAGLTTLVGVLGYVSDGKIPFLSSQDESSDGKGPEKEPTNGKMVLGEEETSFQMEMTGYMSYVPDGPITYWTTKEGKRRYLLTGGDMNQDRNWDGNATYMLETDGTKSLKEKMASGEITGDNFTQVYGPDKNIQYRKHYAGITSVLQTDISDSDHLIGIAHCEERTSRNASGDYTSTIGLTESFDGGKTWIDKGPLIVGTDVKTPGGGRVSGAGQPSAVVKDGYAYIIYIDWSATGKHKDQLYMARAKANDNGSLGQIEYFTDNGFSNIFEGDKLKSIIPVPEGSNFVYTALPHVSWNTELNQYICSGECDTGFWMASSPDLSNWSTPELIYDFSDSIMVLESGSEPQMKAGKPHSILKKGEKWDSYPSSLDESQPNSQITGKNGIFYHSTGDNLNPHEPATVDFEIKP